MPLVRHLAAPGELYGVACHTSGKFGGLLVEDDTEYVTCKRCLAQAKLRPELISEREKEYRLGNICDSCGGPVRVMAYRGTGLCSQVCAEDANAEGWP